MVFFCTSSHIPVTRKLSSVISHNANKVMHSAFLTLAFMILVGEAR